MRVRRLSPFAGVVTNGSGRRAAVHSSPDDAARGISARRACEMEMPCWCAYACSRAISSSDSRADTLKNLDTCRPLVADYLAPCGGQGWARGRTPQVRVRQLTRRGGRHARQCRQNDAARRASAAAADDMRRRDGVDRLLATEDGAVGSGVGHRPPAASIATCPVETSRRARDGRRGSHLSSRTTPPPGHTLTQLFSVCSF